MEVASAESKGAHAGTTRVVRATNPRTRTSRQVEWTVFNVHLGIWAVDLNGRRQHLTVKGQDGLEQASRTSGRLGMTNLGLDRAERNALWAFVAKHQAKSTELGSISSNRAGSVRFHKLDRLWVHSGGLVRPTNRLGLTGAYRCIDGL